MKLISRLAFVLGLAAVLAVAGCNSQTKKKNYDTVLARFLLEANATEGFETVTLPVSGVQIGVNVKPVLTEFDFTGVEIAQSDLGKFLVFYLTPDATRDTYRLTATNLSRRLVLFINGVPVGARMIERAMNTGSIGVFVALPEEDLPKLVKNMDATFKDFQKELAKAK